MRAAISKAARTPSLQGGEKRPDGVVERSLHVAGDDRVPFPAHLAPTVPPSICRARSCRGVAAPRSPAVRARRDPRGLHGQERRLRADVSRKRHLRLHPRRAIRIHAAAVRLLPRPYLLDRTVVVDGRGRADRRRDRNGMARLCDRKARRIARGGARRRVARDAPSILVWHDIHLNREILDSCSPRPPCCSRSSRQSATVPCGGRPGSGPFSDWPSSAMLACCCFPSCSAYG